MNEEKKFWIQRFCNYRKALSRLATAVEIVTEQIYDDCEMFSLLQEGLIQRFEYTYELAWSVMKDYAECQGYTGIQTPNDAYYKAFEKKLITDKNWLELIEKRDLVSHYYDEKTADEICESIIDVYYPLFVAFEEVMLPFSEI